MLVKAHGIGVELWELIAQLLERAADGVLRTTHHTGIQGPTSIRGPLNWCSYSCNFRDWATQERFILFTITRLEVAI